MHKLGNMGRLRDQIAVVQGAKAALSEAGDVSGFVMSSWDKMTSTPDSARLRNWLSA
jgi:hypothetical protein